MIDLKRKLATGLATGAVLANALTPLAFAGTTIQISGNGSDSDNDAVVNYTQNTSVNQTNSANITNNVDVESETGDNDANRNTGGDVNVTTGNASATVNVSNSANANHAQVDCCPTGDTDVLIQGNGDNSNNTINLDWDNKVKVNQHNDADYDNNLYVDAKTGNNDANRNTGGNVSVDTGDASAKVWVSNAANWNSARVGGGNGDGDGGSLSLRILDNGADSDNDLSADVNSTTNLTQTNAVNVDNDIDVESETGDNDANRNTGGDVMIDTGDANVTVDVDNMANFNWADVDCGCPFEDLLVKIDGNGDDSNNTLNADLDFNQRYNQHNDADFDNDLDEVEADTGDNDARRNTGATGGDSDPAINTGDADANVSVNSSANMNSVGGDAPDWELPDFDFGFDLSLSFDLSDLLDALGL